MNLTMYSATKIYIRYFANGCLKTCNSTMNPPSYLLLAHPIIVVFNLLQPLCKEIPSAPGIRTQRHECEP